MAVHQDARGSFSVTLGLLKHRKLIGEYGLVFVNGSLNMPAGEVAAIGARKRAGAESADRSALPVTVVDIGFVLADAGIWQRLAERSPPSGFRNFVGMGEGGQQRAETKECDNLWQQISLHRSSAGKWLKLIVRWKALFQGR